VPLVSVCRFFRVDSLAASHRLKVEAILDARLDYSYVQVIVNKWRGELNCLCTVHAITDETNTLLETIRTWQPLPDPTAPPMREEREPTHAGTGGGATTTT
jgi:hypothetical protein